MGAAQVFEVQAYGADQKPLANTPVSLKSVSATGAIQTLTGVTGLNGRALFNVAIATKVTEYEAKRGALGSNTVRVKPVLTLP